MGVQVIELNDGLEIQGGAELRGARVASFGDHRIAMAFAVAGMFADGETIVQDVECVRESYPGFEKALDEFVSSKRTRLTTPVISSITPSKSRGMKTGKHIACVPKAKGPATVLDRRRVSRRESSGPPRVIAIDGPAASGKSSVARELGETWLRYVNSGAMYRAVTWHLLQRGIAPGDGDAVTRLVETSRIDCDLNDHGSRILG